MTRTPEQRARRLQQQRESYHRRKKDPAWVEHNRKLWREKQRRRRADPERLEQLRAKDRERMQARLADPVERQKIDARGKVGRRVTFGTFPRPEIFTCCDCNAAPAVEYHHETYEQWWGIEALCRDCHERRHHP